VSLKRFSFASSFLVKNPLRPWFFGSFVSRQKNRKEKGIFRSSL